MGTSAEDSGPFDATGEQWYLAMESMDREYLNKGIDNFGRSRILVVGDIILDQFIW